MKLNDEVSGVLLLPVRRQSLTDRVPVKKLSSYPGYTASLADNYSNRIKCICNKRQADTNKRTNFWLLKSMLYNVHLYMQQWRISVSVVHMHVTRRTWYIARSAIHIIHHFWPVS